MLDFRRYIHRIQHTKYSRTLRFIDILANIAPRVKVSKLIDTENTWDD